MRLTTTLVLSMFLASCNRLPTEPAAPPRPLPSRFQMIGTAEMRQSDGTWVSCDFEFTFELAGPPAELPGVLAYRGKHRGAARRTVLNASGNGISLQPDVAGDVIARSIEPDRVQILIPVNTDAQGRFWRELAVFDGTFQSPNLASGPWNCAPFDIDSGGWIDKEHTVRGRWTLAPLP